jgi:hypothetical protein
MSVGPEETGEGKDKRDTADRVIPDLPPPGLQESFVLAMDWVLAFVRLFKAESSLALSALPLFVGLNVARLPVYLLTWISFVVLASAVVYSLTENLMLAAGTFFVLQLGLVFMLERALRKARAACGLPETRKSMALATASLKERFKHEQGHS